MSRLPFVSQYVYPLPLDVVVGSFCVVSSGGDSSAYKKVLCPILQMDFGELPFYEVG
jgi:hypothetical protein